MMVMFGYIVHQPHFYPVAVVICAHHLCGLLWCFHMLSKISQKLSNIGQIIHKYIAISTKMPRQIHTFSLKKENTLQKKAGKLAYLARTTPKTNGLRSTFEEKRENRDFYSLSKPLCQHFFPATVSKMFSPVGTKPPSFVLWLLWLRPETFLFPFLFAIAEGQKRH